MARRLDWDKEGRERRVREHGSERAESERITGLPPSDAQVRRLVRLGYTGHRPATSVEANELIGRWEPGVLGLGLRDVRQASLLGWEARETRCLDLLRSLEENLPIAEAKIRATTKRPEKREASLDELRRKSQAVRDALEEMSRPKPRGLGREVPGTTLSLGTPHEEAKLLLAEYRKLPLRERQARYSEFRKALMKLANGEPMHARQVGRDAQGRRGADRSYAYVVFARELIRLRGKTG
jgi:hypothetical protein